MYKLDFNKKIHIYYWPDQGPSHDRIKDKNGKIQEQWIQCDDENVSEKTEESIQKEVIPNGCYYLYERQNE